jgi:prefoldin subunit 5
MKGVNMTKVNTLDSGPITLEDFDPGDERVLLLAKVVNHLNEGISTVNAMLMMAMVTGQYLGARASDEKDLQFVHILFEAMAMEARHGSDERCENSMENYADLNLTLEEIITELACDATTVMEKLDALEHERDELVAVGNAVPQRLQDEIKRVTAEAEEIDRTIEDLEDSRRRAEASDALASGVEHIWQERRRLASKPQP